MSLTLPTRTRLADSLGGTSTGNPILYLGLHSIFPDESGLGELTGGSPAYARKAVTWASGVNGLLAMTGSVTFDIPAASTVAFVGLWSALTTGTCLGSVVATGGTVYGYGVGRAASTILSPAHGLVTNDTVILLPPKVGVSIPVGYVAGTIYKVSVVDGDTFYLRDTTTNTTVAPSTTASLMWQRLVVDTFAAQGTLTVSALQIQVNI